MNGQMTTLCYLERDGEWLMLHRTRKEGDLNRDKWLGVGGRFEPGESPEECVRREVLEETGFVLDTCSFRGIVTFCCGDTYEYMFLFTASRWHGTQIECDEGELTWIDKERVWGLNLWEGDKIFFRLLDEKHPFFSLKLVYHTDGTLAGALLDGKPMELFDIYDEEGQKTGLVKERGVAYREGAYHHTVHMWIARKNEKGGRDLLVQKRAACKDSNPGDYDISSAGHIEAGGETLPAAKRELMEELGLSAEESDLHWIGIHKVDFRSEFRGIPFHDREFSDVYVLEKPVDETKLTLQAEEVEEVRWFDFDELKKAVEENTIPHCIYPDELEMLERYFFPERG